MNTEITPFDTVEEAWFWFIAANKATQDGARIRANEGLYKRPCEPSDIFKICERLRRHRRLDMHHFRVLKHYGVRMIAPDETRAREVIAARLWREAMNILGDVFESKGIVRPMPSATIIHLDRHREAHVSWS